MRHSGGFSLIEVLVAFLLASLALCWLLLWLSGSLAWRWRLEERRALAAWLEEAFWRDVVGAGRLAELASGPVTLRRDGLTFVFTLESVQPLDTTRPSPLSLAPGGEAEEQVLSRLRESEATRALTLTFVRAEARRGDKTLLTLSLPAGPLEAQPPSAPVSPDFPSSPQSTPFPATSQSKSSNISQKSSPN